MLLSTPNFSSTPFQPETNSSTNRAALEGDFSMSKSFDGDDANKSTDPTEKECDVDIGDGGKKKIMRKKGLRLEVFGWNLKKLLFLMVQKKENVFIARGS